MVDLLREPAIVVDKAAYVSELGDLSVLLPRCCGSMTLLSYIIINLFNYVLKLFLIVWCPCLAINLSVHDIGGFLSDISYTVDPILLPSGNPFKCHEEVLDLQPMIPPKRFDIFPSAWGMLRRSRCVHIFL